jgi:2-dehydropantoate 2-reductase
MTTDVRTPSSPLTIAIIGVGKIGSTFAYQLAQAGHHVTAIVRPGSQRLAQLQRDSAIVTNKAGRASVAVSDALDETVAYDLVVVTTLAHQVDAVLPALRRSQAQSILFMFNIFEPERLRTAVGAERATFGMPMVVASLNAEGALRSTISAGRKTLHGDRRWARLFDTSGIPSTFEENMLTWLRCHVPVCAGMEAISIAGKRRGAGASWGEAMTVARGLQAIFKMIRAMGYPVIPRSKAMMASSPTFLVAAMLWLVSRVPPIRNAMANGVDECRSLIDEVIASSKAKPAGIPSSSTTDVLRMKPGKS